MCYDMCIAFSTLANHNCLSLPSGYTKNTKNPSSKGQRQYADNPVDLESSCAGSNC